MQTTFHDRAQHHTTPPLQLGNSSPLGLLAFASASLLTSVLKISSDKSSQTTGTLAATAICQGAFAQLLAAIFQLLQNNTHSATAFGIYGFHWLTVGTQLWINSIFSYDFISASNSLPSAIYSAIFAVITFFLWLPTLRMNAILSSLFIALFLVFVTEIPAAYGVRPAEIASGIIQAIAGALGAYLALSDLVNGTWGRPVLPLFPHKDFSRDTDRDYDNFYLPNSSYHKSSIRFIDP